MKKALLERIPRECWLCGKNGCGEPLELHHIFGGANRRLSEQYGACVYLCANTCHRSGKAAVHNNAETAQRLHEYGQRKLMEENGWDVEDFRLVFGKNYLGEDEDVPKADAS